MRSKFKWIFTLLLALSMQFSFAQEKTVTGVVSDKSGPLPGANVVVKGTTRSAQTDFDGKYSIQAKAGEILLISFTGYNDSSVTVGGASNYNVSLKEQSVQLNEVVILGYDKTATKPRSIAASTTVSAESLKNRPNVTVLQSLAGNVAGLSVISSSGSPGSAKFDLIVRGLGSVNSSTEPLYVVDGVPTNSVVFRNINPEDIESATVLRDASSTSIYGSRSANGVVIIKTKSGKYESNLKISYTSTYGISELTKDKYNLMSSQQLLRLQRDNAISAGSGANTLLNIGLGRIEGSATFNDPLTDAEILRAPNTDWRDVFFSTAQTQTHNLSLTAGGKNLNNFTSLSYTEQDGIINTTNFKRFTYRTNLTGKSTNDRFNYGTSLTMALSKRFQLGQETNAAINNNVVQNPLLGALTGVPYYSENLYPGSGQGLFDLIGTDFDGGNTTLVLQDLLQDGNQPNRYTELKVLANANASYKLGKYFTVATRFGVDYNNSDRVFARAPWSYLSIAVRETSGPLPYGGFEQRTTDRDFGFNIVNSLKYSRVFGKHSLDAGIYMEYIKAYQTINQHQQNGLDLLTYAFGAGTGWVDVGATNPALRPTNSALKNMAGTYSNFASVTYDYNDKYGIDAVIRRDASYRFIKDNTWGTFWSVGGRWNIDKESFMKNSVFNMLKLRASYGIQGNQNLVYLGPGVNPLYSADNLSRDLLFTNLGYGNTGGYATRIGNDALQWEEQTMTNIGLDFGLWKDRLTGNIDVYKKVTDELFLNIPLSASAGGDRNLDGNNGSLENSGIEVALRYKVFRGNDFNLELFGNWAYNKNEYTDIETAPNAAGNIREENGHQINEYWVVPYMGVNPANGNLLFLAADGSLTESPGDEDRRFTGTSYIPIFQGGFGFNVDYKGFTLDTQFSYAFKTERFDYAQLWLNSFNTFAADSNMSTDILNAWTPTNTNSNVPSLTASNFDLGSDFSDMWLKDASYIRLKNVSFGYNFSKKMLEKSFMSTLKLFVQAENLYTWTKWRGFDPEFGATSSVGSFPTPRTVSFGVNVEF
ncbi:MAG: SusC/RagA family TonB-linked outer membrane protein [Flavobacterium sp. JAD_PAG50586_2]|nr:MAG: SusC/RagA family TonB-linked outer membrane protein [Flavobacterium sp. JAD_PAG50586_2]